MKTNWPDPAKKWTAADWERHQRALKRQEAKLDKRDRKLLHKIWKMAELAFERQRYGHQDGWQKLRNALDEAEDEMGPVEDFKP